MVSTGKSSLSGGGRQWHALIGVTGTELSCIGSLVGRPQDISPPFGGGVRGWEPQCAGFHIHPSCLLFPKRDKEEPAHGSLLCSHLQSRSAGCNKKPVHQALIGAQSQALVLSAVCSPKAQTTSDKAPSFPAGLVGDAGSQNQ